MSDEAADLAGEVWRSLRELVLDRNDRRKQAAESAGLTFNRVKALIRIAAEPLTLRALAEYLVIDAPYTTVVVDDLVKRGLAERLAHPQDRRAKLVHATAAGRGVARRAAAVMDTPPDALLALDPEELAVLDRILGKLLA